MYDDHDKLDVYLVKTLRDTWWTSLKDHYRDIQKHKSGDAGESKSTKTITWIFYKEMSFMQQFIYIYTRK